MTIIWHVDDLMVSHKDQDAIDNLIGHLRQAYQHPTMPLVVHEGLVHEYLGMTFDFSSPEEVKIGMRDYINSIIEEGPTSSRGHANTPVATNLFEINTNSPYLNKDAKDLFHHLVAKLLFLCKRVRPDIHTAVAFLTTKVKQPTEDDQSALDRVIKYLNKTRELDFVLRVHDIQIIKWFIDASFGVHQDYKSQTGTYMTMGAGCFYSSSKKQKVNSRSSTEAELVGVNDMIPMVLWTRLFLQGQGFEINRNIVYQDNTST